MNKKVGIIFVNYKDYAQKYLGGFLDGVRKQDYEGEIAIYVVDNATTPESYAYLNGKIPEAKVIIGNTGNDGYAKGNNDGIRYALNDGCDYLLLLNPDIEIEPDCVTELVKAAENDERIGAVQARLMLWPQKDKINSVGNSTHFLGFGYCEGYGENIVNYKYNKSNSIFYPSGAAVLYKAGVLKQVGLHDEVFWMYNEDQDLGWRIWLGGFKCVLAQKAVVYHKYEFSRSITKYYWMDRNRVIVMLKNYRLGTLLLIAPAFLIMELGLILFSIKGGWFREKVKVWKWFLSPANWLYLYSARKIVQSNRKIKDRELVSMIVGRIWYQEVDDIKLRLVNPVFDFYWKMVRKLIVW